MTDVQPVGIIPDITIPGLDPILKVVGDPGFWARFGVIFLGSVLIIIGIVLLVAGSKGVQQAANMAVGVASKGLVKGVAT